MSSAAKGWRRYPRREAVHRLLGIVEILFVILLAQHVASIRVTAHSEWTRDGWIIDYGDPVVDYWATEGQLTITIVGLVVMNLLRRGYAFRGLIPRRRDLMGEGNALLGIGAAMVVIRFLSEWSVQWASAYRWWTVHDVDEPNLLLRTIMAPLFMVLIPAILLRDHGRRGALVVSVAFAFANVIGDYGVIFDVWSVLHLAALGAPAILLLPRRISWTLLLSSCGVAALVPWEPGAVSALVAGVVFVFTLTVGMRRWNGGLRTRRTPRLRVASIAAALSLVALFSVLETVPNEIWCTMLLAYWFGFAIDARRPRRASASFDEDGF